VRFVVPARDQVLHDLVRGEVRFPAGMVGDFVLLRSSGLPTYNFACVVDDAAMRISHVIRAEEHLSNTARQLMLYAAFAAAPPAFAHVPLILNSDRTKMSKRSGEAAVAVGDWRAAGFLSEALLSYLALLGFHPGDDREVLSREDLLAAFTLDRVGKSGSVFDPAKLRWTNAQVLHHLDAPGILARGARFLPPAALELGERTLERMIEVVRGNLHTLADLGPELAPYLSDGVELEPEARAALESVAARTLCRELSQEIGRPLEPWGGDVFKSAVQSVGKRLGLKGKELFMPVRAALTGRTHGPELPVVAELLGARRCERRLDSAAAGGRREGDR
jgi:nondiscriminating glutamyl-tRNA synthetase